MSPQLKYKPLLVFSYKSHLSPFSESSRSVNNLSSPFFLTTTMDMACPQRLKGKNINRKHINAFCFTY